MDWIKIVDFSGSRPAVYCLIKFSRSNQSNSYNQKPIVYKGDHVEKGEVIADGPSTKEGEIALDKTPLIGFMTWEGYNYEDAVLLSERLVHDDVYTSVHIEEYEAMIALFSLPFQIHPQFCCHDGFYIVGLGQGIHVQIIVQHEQLALRCV